MKSISFNIRFLTWVLIVGCVFIILWKVWNEIIFLDSESDYKLLGVTIPSKISYTTYKFLTALYCISIAFIIFHINTFRKVMTDFFDDLIFSDQNGLQQRQISNGILYFAIFISIFKIIIGTYSSNSLGVYTTSHSEGLLQNLSHTNLSFLFGYNTGRTLWTFLPLLIISQVILLISEMIKKGYSIKSENDLTI